MVQLAETLVRCESRETGEIDNQQEDGILDMGNNVNALHSQVGGWSDGGGWGGVILHII